MGFVARTGAAVAVAIVAGTSVLAHPVDAPERSAPVRVTAAVEYAASSTALRPRPNAAAANAAADGSTPVADAIDDAFIDFTVVLRTGITPVLNRLGYLGKQLYIGLNLIESITASAVFNGTDVLRGEGVLRNLGDVAFDVGLSGLFVVFDELSLSGNVEAIVIDRPPLDHPARWDSADRPRKGFPLTVPDRDPPEITTADAVTEPVDDSETTTRDPSGPRPLRDGIAQWKAKRAEKTEKAAEAREARKARRDAEKADRPDTSASTGNATDSAGDE